MIPEILSVGLPVTIVLLMATLAAGLISNRSAIGWDALAVLAAAWVAAQIPAPAHHLYFDEDNYIQIATTLRHTGTAAIALSGAADAPWATTYYKEPPGFPTLVALVFAVLPGTESTAHGIARGIFALAVTAIYLLASAILPRTAAIAAPLLFLIPRTAWDLAASAGTDMLAVALASAGLWATLRNSLWVALPALALASLTRMEALALLVGMALLSPHWSRWRTAGIIAALPAAVHVAYVLSIRSTLAAAEGTSSVFSLTLLPQGVARNAMHLAGTPDLAIVLTLGIAGLVLMARREGRRTAVIWAWPAFVFLMYASFYAGSLEGNPRYAIPILASLAVGGAWTVQEIATRGSRRGWTAALTGAMMCGFVIVRLYVAPSERPVWAIEHDQAVRWSRQLTGSDVVIASDAAVFQIHGVPGIHAVFAAERLDQLRDITRGRQVWWFDGIRASSSTIERAARAALSEGLKRTTVDSVEIRGYRFSLYRIEW